MSGIRHLGFYVSIHAPLARSNLESAFSLQFNIWFQYMLLLRGATWRFRWFRRVYNVSIHAPLARSNCLRIRSRIQSPVSIHAPLARSNSPVRTPAQARSVSIHAPLARSNTAVCLTFKGCKVVSIHAPLARSNMAFLLKP